MRLNCCIAPGTVRSLVPEAAGNRGLGGGFRDIHSRAFVSAKSGEFAGPITGVGAAYKAKAGSGLEPSCQRVEGK